MTLIRKPLIFLGIPLLLILMMLAGCTQPQPQTGDPRFVGTWIGTYSWNKLNNTVPQANITFRADGTYHASMPFRIEDGTWSVNDVTLTKTMNGSSPVQYTFLFSQNGAQLVLTSTPLNDQWNLTKRLTGPY